MIFTSTRPRNLSQSGKRTIPSFLGLGLCVGLHAQSTIHVDENWATYVGGGADDVVTAVHADDFGHVYIAGRTGGGLLLGNDTTGQSGLTYQAQYGGGTSDAFLAKIAPKGSVLWCTYFGGPDDDEAVQIVVKGMEGVYLIGNTNSTSAIASDTCYQDQLGGGADAFMARFTEYGLLLGATYLGGPDAEAATGGALDGQGRVVVCGWSDGPSTFAGTTPLVPWYAGSDGFLAVLQGTDSLVHCTYVGGPGQDTLVQVGAMDSTGSVILGNTTSTTGIATADAWMPMLQGEQDAFVLQVDTDLVVTRSTYFGGAFNDRAMGLALATNRVVICGGTRSPGLPTDSTAIDTVLVGDEDAFLAEFNDTLQFTWCTYIGDTADDVLQAVVFDTEGSLYAVGGSRSPELIDQGVGVDSVLAGTSDGLVLRLDSAHVVQWSSFLGDMGEEEVGALCVLGHTSVMLGGHTSSDAGIAQNGHQMNYGGDPADGFTTRWDQERSTPCTGICTGTSTGYGGGSGGGGGSCNGVSPPLPQLDLCLGQSHTLIVYGGALGLGAEWMWYADGCGDPVHFLTSGDTITITPTASFVLSVRAESVHHSTSCQYLQVNVHEYPTPTVFVQDTACQGTPFNMHGTGADSFTWVLPDTTFADADSASYIASSSGVVEVGVTATNGPSCSVDLQEQVVVLPTPSVAWSVDDVTCHNGADGGIALDSTNAIGLIATWNTAGLFGTDVTGLSSDTFIVTPTDTLGCTRTDTLLVTQPPPLIDSIATTTALCGDSVGTAQVITSSNSPGLMFDWGDGPAPQGSIAGLAPGSYTP